MVVKILARLIKILQKTYPQQVSEYLELDIMNLMEDVQAHINELTSTQIKEVASKKKETSSSMFDDFYSGFSGEKDISKENAATKANKAKGEDNKSKVINLKLFFFYSD